MDIKDFRLLQGIKFKIYTWFIIEEFVYEMKRFIFLIRDGKLYFVDGIEKDKFWWRMEKNICGMDGEKIYFVMEMMNGDLKMLKDDDDG